jgi:hypothetical protein
MVRTDFQCILCSISNHVMKEGNFVEFATCTEHKYISVVEEVAI